MQSFRKFSASGAFSKRSGSSALNISFCLSVKNSATTLNAAVAVNLFPVTGQPLPLVSMGGTSVWFTCISIGIILSVSKSNEEKETIAE